MYVTVTFVQWHPILSIIPWISVLPSAQLGILELVITVMLFSFVIPLVRIVQLKITQMIVEAVLQL